MTKAYTWRAIYVCIAVVCILVALAVFHRYEKRTVPIRTLTVTILPGSTINTVAKTLSRAGLPAQAFLKLTMPGTGTSATTTASTTMGLEGYLYPDTYRFTSNESAARIVRTMTDNFEAHFPEDLFDAQQGTVRSKRDIVIMASILEKEVATEEDKKIVAGILWKRLDHNLPLQVDSTGAYFLADSPLLVYNTYQTTGLPSGPICNPSLESMQAALLPTATEYWYFLSTRDGRIVYSRTLGEHLINKATYLE